MSKLKKIMGIGVVVTILFILILSAAPITAINKPTLALSQTVQSALIARGSTPFGTTAWQQYFDEGAGVFEQGVFVDVDTSSAGFTTTPIYITSLGGGTAHWGTTGATSIYTATPTGFRVHVRYSNGAPLTPAIANGFGWHINWIAVPN
jgi:hypothetical protein